MIKGIVYHFTQSTLYLVQFSLPHTSTDSSLCCFFSDKDFSSLYLYSALPEYGLCDTVHYILYNVHCTLYTVHCPYRVRCMNNVYNVHDTHNYIGTLFHDMYLSVIYNKMRTMYIVHVVHCTFYIVHIIHCTRCTIIVNTRILFLF